MHTNQTNIDAQQNTTAKKCAFWSVLTENQCQLLQLVTWKIKHMHHLAGFCLKWKNLEFFRSAAETRWAVTSLGPRYDHYKMQTLKIEAFQFEQWDPFNNHYKHLIGFLRGSWRASSQIRCFFSNRLSRLGFAFAMFFFRHVHRYCNAWGWAARLYSYKIMTQQSSPNTNSLPASQFWIHVSVFVLFKRVSKCPWRAQIEFGIPKTQRFRTATVCLPFIKP